MQHRFQILRPDFRAFGIFCCLAKLEIKAAQLLWQRPSEPRAVQCGGQAESLPSQRNGNQLGLWGSASPAAAAAALIATVTKLGNCRWRDWFWQFDRRRTEETDSL